MAALSGLLERVSTYSALLKDQMDRVKTRRRDVKANEIAVPPKSKAETNHARKRALVDTEPEEDATSTKRVRVDDDAIQQRVADEGDGEKDSHAFVQPVLVTGAKLKDYQLEGVAWMAGLYKNGISGILGMIYCPLPSPWT